MSDPFPNVPKDLLDKLEEVFPKKDYEPNQDVRQLDYAFGQRSVVNFLRAKREEQNENILTTE